MKTPNSRFVVGSILMGFIFLLSGCGGVYNSTNIPMQQALETDKPLKIKTTEGTIYKVHRLEQDDSGIHGIAKKTSNTARKHKENIVDNDYQGKFVKLDLPEDSIQQIRTKNKELSILLPVTIGVAIVGLFVLGVSSMAVLP